MRAMRHRRVQGRLGIIEEVADLVRYLVGPSGAYVTSQTIHVDGGKYFGK